MERFHEGLGFVGRLDELSETDFEEHLRKASGSVAIASAACVHDREWHHCAFAAMAGAVADKVFMVEVCIGNASPANDGHSSDAQAQFDRALQLVQFAGPCGKGSGLPSCPPPVIGRHFLID